MVGDGGLTKVSLAALRKSYAGRIALDGVTLDAESGEFVTLLGPSGCGKTTTLRCIAGFLEPDAGEITLDGASLRGVPARARDFGVVFQNYALFPHMTVRDNIGYGLRARRVGRAEAATRVAEALGTVGLDGLADRLPRALSGGQQQRVALARALVIRPRLLLLDEPLANLDAQLRQGMRALIRELQQERRITAFYVTHDQSEAMALSDRVAVMEHGRVLQFATPREIYQRPLSPYVATFTGDASVLGATVAAVLAPGRYRVSVAGVQADVSGPEGLTSGAPGRLMLRPEMVSLTDEGLPAVVQSCAYLGAAQHCRALVGAETVQVMAPPNRPIAVGERVCLRIAPEAWLMAAAGR